MSTRTRLALVLSFSVIFLRPFLAAACTIGTTASGCVITGGMPPAVSYLAGEPHGLLSSGLPNIPRSQFEAGLFSYSKTDLTVAAPIPLSLVRVYRSQDRNLQGTFLERDFGLGTRLNYDIFLYSNSEASNSGYTDTEVIMPDGAQLSCPRDSDNLSTYGAADYQHATFTCNVQPSGIWYASRISYNASTPGWDLRRKDGMIYSFGLGAPLQSIHDQYENSVTITHDNGQIGRITSVAASNRRYLEFSYNDTVNNPNEVTDAVTNNPGSGEATPSVHYTYSQDGTHQLLNVTYGNLDPKAQTSYGYGSGIGLGDITTLTVNVKYHTDGSIGQNITTIGYETFGTAWKRLKTVVSTTPSLSPADTGYTYNYGSTITTSGAPNSAAVTATSVTVTLPDTSKKVFDFDDLGNSTGVTLAYNSSIAQTFAYGRRAGDYLLTEIDDPFPVPLSPYGSGTAARKTNFGYDSLGNVTTVTQTPGPGSAGLSNPTAGVTTTYNFDTSETGCNFLTSVQEPLGQTTSFGYDDMCKPTTETITVPVSGSTTRSSTVNFNSLGQVKSVVDPIGSPTKYNYDSSTADLKNVTIPLPNAYSYTSGQDRTAATYTYDGIGRTLSSATSLQAAQNLSTWYTYDAVSDITDVYVPVAVGTNLHTQYGYNLVGDVIQITDPMSKITTIGIPEALDQTEVCDPLGHCVSDNHNVWLARQSSFQDKNGIVTEYNHDLLGRLKTMQPGASATVSLNYADPSNRVNSVTVSTPSQSTGYTYDAADNVMSETWQAVVPHYASTYTINYDYDSNGRRIAMSFQSVDQYGTHPGPSYIYQYYDDDELKSISGSNPTVTVNVGEDSDGRRQAVSVSAPGTNPVTTAYGYYADSSLCAIYYGAAGTALSNPTCNGVNGPTIGNLTYAYDADGRLNDEGGSMLRTVIPAAESATYGSANQLTNWNNCTHSNASCITEDNANNLLKDPTQGGNKYSWDPLNRLETIALPSSTFAGLYTADAFYTYDPLSRRNSAQWVSTNSAESWDYDGTDTVRIVTGTFSNPDSLFLDFLRDPTNGEILLANTSSGGSGRWVPLHNQLGSTIALLNLDTDRLDTTYTYDPYGNTSATYNNPSEPGSMQFPYLYAGMEYDSYNGLYHTPARLYNPQLRRFVSEDPVFGTNLFSYAGNSPTNATDPSGMDFIVNAPAMTAAMSDTADASTLPLDIPGILMAWQGGPNPLQSILQGIFGGGGKSVPQKPPLIPGQNGAINKGGASPLVLVSMEDEQALELEARELAPIAKAGIEIIAKALRWFWVTERHHLLPLQFADRFKAKGLDPEDYVIRIPASRHRLAPYGVHSGRYEDSWNGRWEQFFNQNADPSREQILEQLRRMRIEFGI